ncbi:hypothetical protein KDL29_08760 [bacterium]|nr:hypothetical protein [bacterium]
MTTPEVNRLLMIAMAPEAVHFPELLGGAELHRVDSLRWTSRCGNLLIGVSGVGGHNMAAMTSKLLLENPGIREVANFGSAGAYLESGLEVGDCCMVRRVAKWDLFLDIEDFEQFFTQKELSRGPAGSEELPLHDCNSGCSFSREMNRRRPGFPPAALEDMELYSLAALCQLHELPLWSMKFVSNIVSDSSIEDFAQGFVPNVKQASKLMSDLLVQW